LDGKDSKMAKAKDGESKGGTGKRGAENTSKKGGAKNTEPQTEDQPCLTLTKSAFIVGGCLPSGSHGPDDTLEKAGLISENLRLIFRECVFNGVAAAGCAIDRGQIPNDADTEIGDVVKAVFQNSH
jgi:hypothetical protein